MYDAAVIGIGGVGGYFGGLLARAYENSGETRIHFAARGRHFEEISANGLLVDTDQGAFVCRPASVTDDIRTLPALDAVLVCVKAYDLPEVLNGLRNSVTERTIVLPLLNGVDIYRRIKDVLPGTMVLPSCVYVGTHIERPGKVTQRGGACLIHFGDDPERTGIDGRFLELLDNGGIRYSHTADPGIEIWTKFMFIAAYGLVGADSGKTIGEIIDDPALSRKVLAVMTEIHALADASGIRLPPGSVGDSFEKGKKFPRDTKTSFQRDFETPEKRDERELFGGTIVRMGKELGVDVSTSGAVYEALAGKKVLIQNASLFISDMVSAHGKPRQQK